MELLEKQRLYELYTEFWKEAHGSCKKKISKIANCYLFSMTDLAPTISTYP
jgi:hypothetical protein